MIDLSHLLPKLVTASCGNDELLETAAKVALTQVAGQGIRKHVKPFRLYRKTLIVAVPDAIWQRQLHQMTAEFVRRVNGLLGSEVVNSIEFRIDQSVAKQHVSLPRTVARETSSSKIPNDIIDAARTISDPDLRQLFQRAAANCVTRRDARR
jgi:hypothetical protein